MQISDGLRQVNNQSRKDSKSPVSFFVFVIILLLCWGGAVINTNWKNLSINKWCISNNAYNEAFDNGVNCGVNALMFFVKQGQKEIDINEVYKKAQEIKERKESS